MAESPRLSIQIALKELKPLCISRLKFVEEQPSEPGGSSHVQDSWKEEARNSPLCKRGVRGDFIGGKEDE